MEEFWRKVSEDKQKIRFQQATNYSPYSEFSRNWIKEEMGVQTLSVNAFYRYDAIMERLFSSKNVTKKQQDWLFDIYMHYLTELECRNGMTRQEFNIRDIQEALINGTYGKKVQEAYTLLDKEEAYCVAHMLERQEKTRESIDKCAEVLVTVLHDGIVYKDENSKKCLLMYLNKKENERDQAVIDMVCELFLPLEYDIRVFWENHFAVLGESKTMMINEIELL